MIRASTLGVGLFLAAQVAWILTGPWRDHSYGNWAPFHEHATYTVEAVVDGEPLSPEQIRARYGCYAHFYDQETDRDWQLNRMSHGLGWNRVVEAASPQQAEVSVRYRVNGGPEQRWTWP